MELIAKITEAKVVELIVDYLRSRDLFVGTDEEEVLVKTLQNSSVFPLSVATELMAIPRPVAPPTPDPPSTPALPNPEDVPRRVQEHPVIMGHTSLLDPHGTGPTKDLVQDEGESIGDQISKLLQDNAKLIEEKK